MQRILSFGAIFWNLAILPPGERDAALADAVETVCKTEEDKAAFLRSAIGMIARHEAMFPWLHERRR